MSIFPIGPLSLDSLTRDTWGSFDAPIIAQLAPLVENDCYQPKLYRAPDIASENFAKLGYASYGLKITPGSIIYGFQLPIQISTNLPKQFNVQIRDMSLQHNWWDQPIPAYHLANAKLTHLSASQNEVAAFPCLLDAPYPVVGTGLFRVEMWETSNVAQRLQLIFGVLEATGAACL